MSVKKFKFVSPGIFMREIDKSVLDVEPGAIGPVVIGRSGKGPAGTPVQVRSYSEFVEIFGEPLPGLQTGDVFRDGNKLAPTYAAYAAKAWLSNNTPLTFIRLLGEEHASATTAGKAGWGGGTTSGIAELLQGADTRDSAVHADATLGGGAYALWLFDGSDQLENNQVKTTDAVDIDDDWTAANHDTPATGALAAVFYCDADNTVVLSGTFNFDVHGGQTQMASAEAIQLTASQAVTIGTGSNGTLSVLIGTPKLIVSASNDDGVSSAGVSSVTKIDFDFNEDSDSFIRKVFNTNPTLTNGNITTSDNTVGYFLGETYEGWVKEKLGGWSNVTHGLLMGLKSRNNTYDGANFRFGNKDARTGWFISQDTGDASNYDIESTQKLFRLISLNQGEWLQNNLKMSIEDIQFPNDKYNKYGTFSLAIRLLTDKDSSPQYVEVHRGLDLNPHSPNYIKRRIGDKYFKWNTAEERYREYGEYPNQSKYIRVEMNENVDGGSGEGLLPFGVFGPYRFLNALNVTGTVTDAEVGAQANTFVGGAAAGGDSYSTVTSYHMIVGDTGVGHPAHLQTQLFSSSLAATSSAGFRGSGWTNSNSHAAGGISAQMSSSFYFPELPLRHQSSEGNIDDPRKAYWGTRLQRSGSNIFEESVRDVVRTLPVDDYERDGGSYYTEVSWVFSLDDLRETDTDGEGGGPATWAGTAYYASGSRKAGTSFTAKSGSDSSTAGATGNTGAKQLVNEKKWNRFTTMFHGGFDGFDITEKDPLRNSLLDDASADPKVSYAYNTVKQAIQSIKNPEMLEYNVATIPGVTEPNLTRILVDQCEERADSLAIIDLQNNSDSGGDGNYQPYTENNATEQTRVDYQNLDLLRKKLENREINSSYGCTYYPWVQIRDDSTAAILKVPPSVVALGAMAFSDAVQAPWFAPAGFTRGGLSFGASGLNVVGVTHKLTSEDRDKLYEANINPIATFPAEGIVIFGQKTLQITPSALDRINVRRLLIFVKKEISRIAATTLFDQNVRSTWLGFKNRADALLGAVKSQLGLMDYKIVLDETTTTPDLIDRNIMYAKIYLKPARAIEFIALDFIITDSGASFED